MFFRENLISTQGESIEILHPGFHNHDSGPDFFNAQIKINSILWAGNVEIHINSSDWQKHLHQNDPAYDNVILHVVFKNDREIYDRFYNAIPTLALENRIDPDALQRYYNFIQQKLTIPCARHIRLLERLVIFEQLDRCLVDRLEQKTKPIHELLKLNNFHWEQTAFILLAKNFGFVTNAIPFERLAFNTPYALIQRYKGDINIIEALLFGQSGLIQVAPKTDYTEELILNYNFLKEKHRLKSINKSNWKFSRMRPAGFPTIRIAQMATLLNETDSIMNLLFEMANHPELIRKFRVCASPFWDHHYSFKVPSPLRPKILGEDAIRNLMINTAAPFLFTYGQVLSENQHKQLAIRILENIKPEQNTIVKLWSEFGLKAGNAAESQSILEMHKHWCLKKKCLTCSVGTKILAS